MLNRKNAPEFHAIEEIHIPQAQTQKLSNGINVHYINSGSQELVKIEFLFKAGMYFQEQPLVASSTNNMIEMGSSKYTANEISEKIDYYGGFLELETGQDFASITLYTLNKYLHETIGIIEDILKTPTFPKDEFDIYINNKKQKHLVNSQKVSVLARRRFNELLFGEKHPYGIDVKDADFEKVNINIIKQFFNTHYNSANCTIIVSGMMPESLLPTLDSLFGLNSWGQSNTLIKDPVYKLDTTQQQKHLLEKGDAIQSAIRVGRILFNKRHTDYFQFQVLNTILGGYFGSRLMANIREDKGFTYGIGSGLASLVNEGYFYISTEVGADVTQKALDEIYFELKRLREDKVGADELTTVKNYILGQFLRSVDGPFALADKFKGIWMYGLDYSYYENYFHAVNSATADQLRDLANKYLQEKDMIECVAGWK
ncbi:MAG: M16 family metallopeptidase [Sphingobacteriaceae bacterium]